MEATVKVPEVKRNGKESCMFGVELEKLMGEMGQLGIPKAILICTEYILNNGLDTEGVFRRSPSSVQLKEARSIFDMGQIPDFKNYDMPVHLAAVLIKLFLRELPSPIFPNQLHARILKIANSVSPSAQTVASSPISTDESIVELISLLPIPNYVLLDHLIEFFQKLVMHESKTKMGVVHFYFIISWICL